MTADNHNFKYSIGDKVSGHKPGYGKVYGVISGRTILEYGTELYWVKNPQNGVEIKLPAFMVRPI